MFYYRYLRSLPRVGEHQPIYNLFYLKKTTPMLAHRAWCQKILYVIVVFFRRLLGGQGFAILIATPLITLQTYI